MNARSCFGFGVSTLVAVLSSCNSSNARSDEGSPVGDPDKPGTAAISIAQEDVSGTAQGGVLAVRIPITGVQSGSGSLSAFIGEVDGTKVTAERDVHYSVESDDETLVKVELDLPEVTDQADWFGYNLFLYDPSGLRVSRSLLYVLQPYEVELEGPGTVQAGKPASYRVLTREPNTKAALPDRPVTLAIRDADGKVVDELHGATGDEGTRTFQVELSGTGDYQVLAGTSNIDTEESVGHEVKVAPRQNKVLLTTDKPVYKPGQTLHLRALALRRGDNTPLSETEVTFEVEDGKGNKILQRDVEADQYGIAATDFALGRILNEGTFAVRAIVDEQPTEKTVTVTQYALPKFQLGLTADQRWYRPGQSVRVSVDARYFFGRAVARGAVSAELGAAVAGEQVFDRVMAETDAEGHYEARLQLPNVLPGVDINAGNALAFVRVAVTDTAVQSVERELPLTVSSSPVTISVVPESTNVVPGVENRLLVFVQDPLGSPLGGAEVSIEYGSESLSGTTDEAGHLELGVEPSATGDNTFLVSVTAPGEEPVTQEFSFDSQAGEDHLLVRTDKSVYELGETVEVEVLTSPTTATVFVDWLNAGQAVGMETLVVEGGRARTDRTLDTTLLGDNRIEAYIVDSGGDIVRAGRSVFVRNSGALSIDLDTDEAVYEPGQPARLTFQVRDETGNPQVAALGVQIVDEAVFGVIDARPGLLQTYFELEDEFAEPSYQLRAPGGSFSELFFDTTASDDPVAENAGQSRAEANLAALEEPLSFGIRVGSWTDTVERGNDVLDPYYVAREKSVLTAANRVASAAVQDWVDSGCRIEDYYCSASDRTLRDTVRDGLAENLVVFDFWGNRFKSESANHDEAVRLSSKGPDETAKTSDDGIIALRFSELDVKIQGSGTSDAGVDFDDDDGPEGPGAIDDDTGGDDAVGDDDVPAEDDDGATPRVRRDFPETLYVNPALITDPDGTATVLVPLADSITQWRVSTLGHTAGGKLGGSVAGITVFQDFFVDVDFPATLTRGDEVEFPIAVYNYLDEPQTITLELEPSDWYSALGSLSAEVELAAGEVKSVSFPVRVEEVGQGTLTVTALGTAKSDAVARTVLVEPDGKAFATAQSGSVGGRPVSHTVTFPAEAIEGANELYLNVFPAFLSQAVAGMDSVLQVPNGCFEQTTSTTWPNVLVTRYMQETDQITPEILLRAESLISAGYQRLLTFEHPGGGFSWFGTSDPAPFLSVTAFGLMEFVDMAEVYAVDRAMIERTRDWLVAQQQNDGKWRGDTSEFFSFHESEVRNTAFVLWSLASAEYNGPEMAAGLDYVRANLDTDDPYTLALVANAMVLLNDSGAQDILSRLEDQKQTEGDYVYWSTDTQTNFYGAGNDAAVATTALVTHALLLDGGHAATVEGALGYITAAKDPQGNFGSTQATTWSLRTLLLAATRGTEGAEGSFTASVDGEPFATLELSEDEREVMTTLDLENYATTGEHEVTLSFEGSGKVSYNLVASHHLPWAEVDDPDTGPLSVSVNYDREQLQVDETISARVEVTNNTAETQNMVLVGVGIPPGFDVVTEALDAYVAAGTLSRFELTGRQLMLYVLELPGSETLELAYLLRATLPVRASDGGAVVYPYYEPEKKSAAAATTLEVAAAPM